MYKKVKRYNTLPLVPLGPIGPSPHHIERAKLFARHPVAVPIITFAVLALVSLFGYLIFSYFRPDHNPNVVVISHDGVKQIVSSKEPTVGALLNKLDLKMKEGDVVEPAPETLIQQDDFRINIYRAAPVEVVDGGQRTFTYTASTTERSVVSQAGLTIYPEDRLTREPITDFVSTGSISERVTVERATPVSVNLYGAPVVIRTHAKTVRELIDERKIKLLPQDQVKPAIDAPIASAGAISIVRNGLSTTTIEEPVPMPIQNVPDNNLAYGTSAVRQKGADGRRAVVYEINTQNGAEVSRRVVQSTVIQEPVPEIRVIGSNLSGIKGDMARAGIAPGDYRYADEIVAQESGWCPTKWQGEYGRCPAYHGTPTNPNLGYGLCQSTPAWKMATAGEDWATNPVTQLKWCHGYAMRTYTTWQKAHSFKFCIGSCVHPRTGAVVYKHTKWW